MPTLGHLVSIAADRFHARLDPETHLSPGELVKIPRAPSSTILAYLTSIQLQEKAICATLTPIGEMEGDRFQRGIRSYPRLHAPVFPIERCDLETVYQVWSRMGYSVGTLSGGHEVAVYLHPSLLFSRHFAVVGQSGSGKSWTVAALVQRVLKTMPYAKVVFLDLQGEYGQRYRDGHLESTFEQLRCLDGESLELPYWLLTYEELVSLLVDPKSENATLQRSYLHRLLTELRTGEGKRLGIANPSVDAPLYFPIQELYQRLQKENERRLDFGKRLGPFYGKFVDLLARLEGFLKDSRYRFLFRPRRYTSSESLVSLLKELTGVGEKTGVTLIGVSDLPFEVRPTVCGALARILYEFSFWNPHRGTVPLLLVCEEAHNYLSPSVERRAVQPFERIAKEGRKYGIGLAIVTQRPREVSETILAQCGTYFCLRLSNPEDQDYIARLLTGAERHLLDTLPALGPGEGIVVGDAVPMPLRMRFFRPDPPPRSHDADYFLAWRLLAKGVPVGEIVSAWQRQGSEPGTG